MTRLTTFAAKVPDAVSVARVTTVALPPASTILGTTAAAIGGEVIVSVRMTVNRLLQDVDRSVVIIRDGVEVDEHFVHERNAEFLSTVRDGTGSVYHVFAARGAFGEAA